jgi:hypothetical protein
LFTEISKQKLFINLNFKTMKKVKALLFGGLLASTLLFSTPSNAKIAAQFVHVFENGCIGTHTYHSALFGLLTWETYEVVAC